MPQTKKKAVPLAPKPDWSNTPNPSAFTVPDLPKQQEDPSMSPREMLEGSGGYGSKNLFNSRLTEARGYVDDMAKQRTVSTKITDNQVKGLFESLTDLSLDRKVPIKTDANSSYYVPALDEVHIQPDVSRKNTESYFNVIKPEEVKNYLVRNSFTSNAEPNEQQVEEAKQRAYTNAVPESQLSHEMGHAVQKPMSGSRSNDFYGTVKKSTGLPFPAQSHEDNYGELINYGAMLQRHLTKQGSPLNDKHKARIYLEGIMSNSDDENKFEGAIKDLPSDVQRMFRNFRIKQNKTDKTYSPYLEHLSEILPALVNNNPTATSIFA